jgi:catechol 2,3-dioxygenase-like lactoylglutathione lyase family enzyme
MASSTQRRRYPGLVACLLGLQAAQAQIAPPNAAGVSMGHLHYFVADVDANRDFWVRLGGTAVPFAAGEIVRLPGVLILLSERGASERESAVEASLVDHVAFRVESLAALASAGFELEMVEAFPGIASIYTPDGDRVELFEEGTATNVGFDPEPGLDDPVAGRHNRPLVGALDSHHLHFYLPEDEVLAARDWYARHFGAVPGTRWRYDAADLPGMNLNFSATPAARAPTSGQSLDHVGFEIEDLEAFCLELEAAGVALDQAFRRVSPAFAFAILTDPWGTTLELTQGLTGL